ncbi:MAG: hypothetical protein AAF081_16255 [Actinomycetota bacterium]
MDEFVQIDVERLDSTWTWNRHAWHLVDGVSVPAWSDTGTVEIVEYFDGYDAIAALAPDTCEGARG